MAPQLLTSVTTISNFLKTSVREYSLHKSSLWLIGYHPAFSFLRNQLTKKAKGKISLLC
jgi:hypothetical protein